MLVLRYRHRLPADYAMGRIRERAAGRGPLWDTAPGLAFKAFTATEAGGPGGSDNGYASTYLWLDPGAATAFLTDDRFRAVIDGFGRPRVGIALPLAVAAGSAAGAAHLTHERIALAAGCDLAALRAAEAERAAAAVAAGACAAVSALDPEAWQLVRVALHRDAPAAERPEAVLHLAAPGWAHLAR